MDKKTIDILSFVKSSKHRAEILLFIGNKTKIPSEIAKHIKLSNTHTSKYLNSLKEKELIICLNEEAKRGRLYQLTEKGKEVLKHIIH
jgi:DNA-binding MarR family transcriptional regulator